MNWFERYGIVGMFFIVMTGIWFFCLFPDSYSLLSPTQENEVLSKYIIGFCTLGFLPIGYIIIVLGQLYYYQKNSFWEKIHCNNWKDLSPPIQQFIQEKEKNQWGKALSNDDLENEAKMEAVLCYYVREHVDDIKIEAHKFLASFGTKRYDVISINRGLLHSILLSFIFAVCIKLIALNITIIEFLKFACSLHFSIVFIIVIAIFIWIILRKSSRILEHQIIEIQKRIISNINFRKE